MWTRAELKDNAKKFFKFNYWKMVLVSLVMTMVGGGGGSSFSYSRSIGDSDYGGGMTSTRLAGFMVAFIIVFLIIMVLGTALSAFLFNPLSVGAQRFFVISHYQKADLGELGYAFSNSYMNVVKTMFLRGLYTFLWSLLLIVPGIIKGYEYRMIPYILAENPGIDSRQAFAMSKQMMDGNKWNAFVLDLSFIGWNFLSLFTCGILSIFYVNPYMLMTDAELYVALKEITFGSGGNGYQNFQPNQGFQNYQMNQDYQNYQAGGDYQGGQNYQNYQPYQSYQNDQSYQGYQNDQGGQPNQGYENSQNYQGYQNGGQVNADGLDQRQPDDGYNNFQ